LTVLQESYKEVEDQDDEHLYRTLGWGRELWIQGLGMPAMLPPSVEEEVKTAVGAARAKQERGHRRRPIDFAMFARACGGTGLTIERPSVCGSSRPGRSPRRVR
jgi:hypothetical protein